MNSAYDVDDDGYYAQDDLLKCSFSLSDQGQGEVREIEAEMQS